MKRLHREDELCFLSGNILIILKILFNTMNMRGLCSSLSDFQNNASVVNVFFFLQFSINMSFYIYLYRIKQNKLRYSMKQQTFV